MTLPQISKETRKVVIAELAKRIYAKKLKNNSSIPYGFVAKVIGDNREISPWLTPDILHYQLKKIEADSASDTSTTSATSTTSPCLSRSLSLSRTSTFSFSKPEFLQVSKETGRPKGSTDRKRKAMEIDVMATTNHIADLYYVEMKKAGKKEERVKKER